MDIYSYATMDSSSPGSGALVTQGGLGVAKSANVGSSVTVTQTSRARLLCIGQTCLTEQDLARIIQKLQH